MPHAPTLLHRIRSLFNKPPSSPFQIVSDLHLEVGQQYTSFRIPPTAPYLILAGDIGRLVDYDNYLTFLASLTPHYKHIFLILGNHEFYTISHGTGLLQAQKLVNEPSLQGKVVLSHQRRFDVPDTDVTILGCTLWSHIPNDARLAVQSRVKDYEKIHEWTIDAHNNAHISDLAWLKSQIADIARENVSKEKGKGERRILVVTHHAPCIEGTSSPRNVANAWSSAFATELVERTDRVEEGDVMGTWRGVKVWVFGHTHWSTDFVRSGIRVVGNQRGYVLPGNGNGAVKRPSEPGERNFDVRMVISI